MTSNIIDATPYSCTSDRNNLDAQKQAIAYHTANIGNKAKSTITASELKKMQEDYNVAKKKYDASDCGKDVERDNCIALDSRIATLRLTVEYFMKQNDFAHANKLKIQVEELVKKFNESKCGSKIGEFRADVVSSISDVYKEMDKKRIEEQSKYQVKQKVFFGAIVLFGAVLMVTIFSKKQ